MSEKGPKKPSGDGSRSSTSRLPSWPDYYISGLATERAVLENTFTHIQERVKILNDKEREDYSVKLVEQFAELGWHVGEKLRLFKEKLKILKIDNKDAPSDINAPLPLLEMPQKPEDEELLLGLDQDLGDVGKKIRALMVTFEENYKNEYLLLKKAIDSSTKKEN